MLRCSQMYDDCQSCGACCFSDSSTYVHLSEADRELLGDELSALVHEEDNTLFMAMKDGHCQALEVHYGAFVCSIYERRPLICRELERGTPACQEERKLKVAKAAALLVVR
jgi:Fe-S-cluster containining protein